MKPAIGRLFHFRGNSYVLLEFTLDGEWIVRKLGDPSERVIFSPETVAEVLEESEG